MSPHVLVVVGHFVGALRVPHRLPVEHSVPVLQYELVPGVQVCVPSVHVFAALHAVPSLHLPLVPGAQIPVAS